MVRREQTVSGLVAQVASDGEFEAWFRDVEGCYQFDITRATRKIASHKSIPTMPTGKNHHPDGRGDPFEILDFEGAFLCSVGRALVLVSLSSAIGYP